MAVTKENADQVRDLLKQLSQSRSFESADIATRIRKLIVPAPDEGTSDVPKETAH